MTTVLLTTTGAGTWTVPTDVTVGQAITVEAWGAGSGGTGRVSTTFGAAGAGGAYAQSQYTITPNDVVNGVSYTIGAGSAGASGANPAAGGNTSWSTNNLNLMLNSLNQGAAVGTPGTLPTGWTVTVLGTLSISVVEFGTDSSTGLPYIDIRIFGTTNNTSLDILFPGPSIASPSTAYNLSGYLCYTAGSLANISAVILDYETFTSAWGYLSDTLYQPITLTPTLTRFSGSGTSPATTGNITLNLFLNYSSGVAIDITLRFAGIQFEQGSSATVFKSSPGYTLAVGGGAPSGTTGGVGGSATNSVGTVLTNAGGNGAAYNTGGSGGGGAGGNDGAGQVGTTAGVGGHGDGTSVGGTGGAVKTTSPGNAGTSNVEGGGGGGGLKTVAGTGGAGGAPGGGGGGAAVATGTGGSGARGQIRLTYISQFIAGINYQRAASIQIWDH